MTGAEQARHSEQTALVWTIAELVEVDTDLRRRFAEIAKMLKEIAA